MKNRIGITISVVSLLISFFLVSVGCRPSRPRGYFTLDLGSAVLQPRFCLYRDPDFQQQLGIEGITVWKVPRSIENQWTFGVPWPWQVGQIAWQSGWKVESLLEGWQAVWDLEYKASDNFIKRLFRRWLTSPVSCLTYGEVPSGYQEKVKALSLEPEEFYGVLIWEHPERRAGLLGFIIRLDGRGIPDRLEYHNGKYIITRFNTFTNPRDDLRLSK